LAISQQVADMVTAQSHVLITGERGVGKRHAALAIAAARHSLPTIVDAADAAEPGAERWLEQVSLTLGELSEGCVVVVAHLERLDPAVLGDLMAVLDTGKGPSLAIAVRPDPTALRNPPDALNVFGYRVHIPALRHRAGDVGPLARHFDARHGAGGLTWSAEVLEVMEGYLWPGNVRQLEQTVQDLLARLRQQAVVQPEDLPEDLRQRVRRGPLTRLEEAEVDVMLAALTEAHGNKELAAHLIGIHRATLYRKLQNYGVDWPSDG
jgi:sigma-54 dependent transcriptional regulator, acetoin dehydrogenase operon transcriptional activator AcoR